MVYKTLASLQRLLEMAMIVCGMADVCTISCVQDATSKLLPMLLQIHCARMCGVKEAVLMRAADIIDLHRQGLPVERLQLTSLTARDAQYKDLVRSLAAVHLDDQNQVMKLLQAVRCAEDMQTAQVDASANN